MPGSKFQMKLKPGLAFEFEALQDNLGSGQETGRRQHEPITIVREVDEASPLIWQALCTNESYVSATLSFARPDQFWRAGNRNAHYRADKRRDRWLQELAWWARKKARDSDRGV